MPRSWRHAFPAAALLLLAINASGSQVQVTSSIQKSTPTPSVASPSTCPSRSINYITQTLAQKCFTTSWASKPQSQEIPTLEGSSTWPQSLYAPSDTRDISSSASDVRANFQPAPSDSSFNSGSTTTTTSHYGATASVPSTSETTQDYRVLTQVEQGADPDSPLDNANFLSFEEWKRQNLAKVGQSAEHLGARAGADTETRRRPGAINNALDSLGEDAEIEIDFGGFVDPGNPPPTQSLPNRGSDQDSKDEHTEETSADELSGSRKRGKDAGKTCKERSNYASFDCASTVLKSNPECKGSTAVLVENKDSYMLNICSAKNKFFIVELCDDILIDTIVLANFEFFSSMFRTFRVSVSDRYPVKLEKWRELGTFEARNSREVQAFLVENPLIWARYLRVEFLTHFGNEYYCPVSLLRVHGTTMMEEFNHDVKGARNDDDETGDAEERDLVNQIPSDIVSADALKGKAQETSEAADAISTESSRAATASSTDLASSTLLEMSAATVSSSPKSLLSSGITRYNLSFLAQMAVSPASSDDNKSICKPEDRPDESIPPSPDTEILGRTVKILETSSVITAIQTPSHATSLINDNDPSSIEPPRTVLSNVPDKGAIQDKPETVRASNQTSASIVRVQSSPTQPAHPIPTTQESFFKSVHKRLQLLESNSTLSLQYIEEQSRILREAFSKVEKRQLVKTTAFLETLNTTVLTELRDFRHQYDQIWQSTVLELSSQREQSQHEVLALSARLSLLADEIVFQKRMAIVQFGFILLCLGLIIFSRHSSQAAYLELPPVVQNAIGKSSANLSRNAPSPESAPNTPTSTRPSSRHAWFRGLAHRSSPSEESQFDDLRKSPSIEFSPPTPTSLPSSPTNQHIETASDADERSSDFSPEPEEGAVRQTKSSPCTPSGQRDEHRELGGKDNPLP